MNMTRLSLVQRLWLLMSLIVLLSVGGALVSNLLNARNYLQAQLSAQNADTANALAMMATQHKADPATTETLIRATFDQGHFRRLRWVRADGAVIVERVNQGLSGDAPAWFRQKLPLHPVAGVAQISNGWLQAGQIEVESDLGYAYESLWQGTLQTMVWLLVTGLFATILMSIDILKLRNQLGQVVEQARGIGEQRFLRIPEPRLPELANVVRAMNQMVDTLKRHLLGLKDELEQLRQDKLTDSSTGLPNRAAFLQRYNALFTDTDEALEGHLLIVRIDALSELNQRLGGATTDKLLRQLGSDLQHHARQGKGWLASRLRGAEFALLCPELDPQDADALAESLCHQLALYEQMALSDMSGIGHVGVVRCQTGDSSGTVLLRASEALAAAQMAPANHWARAAGGTALRSEHDWNTLLERICAEKQLALRWFPVKDREGEVLWQEGMLYKPDTEDSPGLSALRLISHALRLDLSHKLDLAALDYALLHRPGPSIAINFSPASLASENFALEVSRQLRQQAEGSLSIEFHETGLADNWEAFLAFARVLRQHGQRVAVEIMGNDLELVARLHEVGIAYLVIDSTLTQGIHDDEGRQALLRGLHKIASLMGIRLIAKGVRHPEDADTMRRLGVDGLTGPAI